MSGLATDDPAHRQIMTQLFGVVHILVSSEATKHGLLKKPDKRMTPKPSFLSNLDVGVSRHPRGVCNCLNFHPKLEPPTPDKALHAAHAP